MPPPTNSREIIARLLREGWVEQPKNGSSHRVFKKPGVREIIVVPHPKRDFGKGYLNTLHKKLGWK
ncbi:MAG: type II toxin-antitoxin system HicA family toxin [Methylobacterium sp.]|jgi:predicted RNA binding protein YcfA (HicA-like mRNA interferase family)|nr:type II toxin-antitoxin system HicA family toxin [Methylobacterium sp.]MCA3606852.1 type II toxin-antitoxin system HicA family toxin [Methylobacterium sp.]MCA3608471.1 type II toxin-antitoxin system HicA family toxin [Methylobacterium sp.]MCA3617528.1 type II toxin-antitoxin system HicA family toxin [Methylobacterium sp.]MCA3620536.1 type II toxin-antitoxin system HicA family toxin [Methylobacterium sp.]